MYRIPHIKTGIALLLAVLFCFVPQVHAEDASSGTILMKPVGDQASSGYFIIEGNPGERKQVTVNLRNSSEQAPASGEFMVADAPNAQGGGMGAITPDQIIQKQVASWFQIRKETIQLKPGESRDVALNFTVPAGTRPGDHIGAVSIYNFVPGTTPDKQLGRNEAAVTVNKAYSQTVAVLIRIPGEVQHKIELKSLEPKMNGSTLFMDLTIVNQGNVIEDTSQGVVQISQGGKLLFENKGEMKSIYPGNAAVYSFEAPAELLKSGKFDTFISWNYASGKLEEHTSKTYDLSPKEVKQAELVQLASSENKKIAKNAIVLNPDDLWKWSIGLSGFLLVLLLLIIIFMRRNKGGKKGRKKRGDRPYPTITP